MATRPWQYIQWRKPLPEVPQLLEARPEADLGRVLEIAPEVIPAPATSSLSAALEASGIPHIPGKTPIEEACLLLKAGAEVEHALLVEYLYAAWSLSDAALGRRIVEIAIQEMCHLITVQNLLLFAGDVPFLDRQDQDDNPALAPFPFRLRPLTKAVLEDFLLAEMPPLKDMNAEQVKVMQPILDAHAVDPAGIVHPVGLIYARIFWLCQKDDQPAEPWTEAAAAALPDDKHIDEFAGQDTSAAFQVDAVLDPAWRGTHNHGGVFETINSRETALKAIADIAAQGEGLVSTPGAPSHFGTFLDIYQSTSSNPLSAVRHPTDPFVSEQPSPDPAREANRITHPLAAALCKVFDARYQILLAALRASLAHSRANDTDKALRAKYATWAFEEMLISIRVLATPIGRLPCKEGGTAAQLAASPCFGLAELELPGDAASLDGVLLALHKSAGAAIAAALAQNPDAVTKLNLQSMQKRDAARFPNL